MVFQPRHVRSQKPIEVDGRVFKRYHVTVDGTPIDPVIVAAAEAFAPSLLPSSDPAPSEPKAGFLVLHRGADAIWLNTYSWVVDNLIVHCRAARSDLDGAEFEELDDPWIGCVWELPAVAHERSAWVRHVLSPASPDLDGYLADVLPDGPVGAP